MFCIQLFSQSFILEVYLALPVAEARSKDRYDWPQFSIFQYSHFHYIEKWRAVAGKICSTFWLFVFFILVVLIDLKTDKKICMLILIVKLSLRFWILNIFKFLLVQFEFNEIKRLVLKPSRTDKKFKHVGGSNVHDIV